MSDPLYDFIPEFKDMYVKGADGVISKAKTPITIRHFFTMAAGFTYDMESEAFKKTAKQTDGRRDEHPRGSQSPGR